MRSINVEDYGITFQGPDGKPVTKPYQVKAALVTILFNPALQIAGRELLLQNDLAKKIEESKKEVLLEEAEYTRIKTAIDAFKGFGRNEVELVDRVLNAETVDVKAAKK